MKRLLALPLLLALGGCTKTAMDFKDIAEGGKCFTAADPHAPGSCADGLYCDDKDAKMVSYGYDKKYREGLCKGVAPAGQPCTSGAGCAAGLLCVYPTVADANARRGTCGTSTVAPGG